MIVDLKAHRCPTAQVLMNRALELFMKSDGQDELVIKSIEPSLRRNIEARIAGLDIAAHVVSESKTEITNMDLMKWMDGPFDEDDFEGVKDISIITIVKRH